MTIEALGARVGLAWKDYQVEAYEAAQRQPGPAQRTCLYFRTGAGKSITSLVCVALWGHDRAVVVAPPSTHPEWIAQGKRLGVSVEPMSHAKFRMKGTLLSRSVPLIADEIHMFGGHGGKGFKKLEGLARGLKAPLVLASATPNYNDAERVYCIQRLLDPASTKGGFLEFLYRECETEQDPFSMVPKVLGFRNHKDAASYLAALPGVQYLPDELVYSINDIDYFTPLPAEMEKFGYVASRHRMIASQMEERHTRTYMQLVGEDGSIHEHVYEILTDLVHLAAGPVLIYANHATVALALAENLRENRCRFNVVTGGMTSKAKAAEIQRFRQGDYDVLVGTASLATGTDGLDKMCNTLIILDDTDDDALRRQLIGRIMPRGDDTDASMKQVIRLVHP